MRILALEFSSERRSVAVLIPGGAASETVALQSERQTRAFHLIDQALAESGIERKDIDCVAVGLGPGSYTGIRAAISIAQGWGIARGIKLLGVSSIAAVAAQARIEGLSGRVTCAIDAQRQEYYVAAYNLDSDVAAALEPLGIETSHQVQRRVAAGEILIGPEAKLAGNRPVFPTAAVVAAMAATRTDFLAGEMLEPIYLRQPNFVKAAPPRFAQT